MSQCDPTPSPQASLDEFSKAGLKAIQDIANALGELANAGINANPVLQQLLNPAKKSICEIPPPCWMPKDLGSLRSVVCPGGVAVLQVCVTNCQPGSAAVKLDVTPSDWGVEIDPPSATLGPMERRAFTVHLTAPSDACKGDKDEVLLWVRGCNNHFARWCLEVSDTSTSSCLQVKVQDCPDYVHHWYDHFYCVRPCINRARSPNEAGRTKTAG